MDLQKNCMFGRHTESKFICTQKNLQNAFIKFYFFVFIIICNHFLLVSGWADKNNSIPYIISCFIIHPSGLKVIVV